jgi:anti-sigma regulatory factor (Ser/Thr protein kinase)
MPDRRRPPSLPMSVLRGDGADDLHRAAREIGRAALLLAGGGDTDRDVRAAQSLDHLGEAARAVSAASLARQSSPPVQKSPDDGATHLHSLRLAPRKAAVTTARRWCDETLDALDGERSAVKDVAGELVANAVRLAADEVVLVVEVHQEAVLVGVWDDGPGVPRLLPYRTGVSDRGVGLRLVNQLSARWGWVEDGAGKWVWARLTRVDTPRRIPRQRNAALARRTAGAASPRAPRA